jgi:hypothetical protein
MKDMTPLISQYRDITPLPSLGVVHFANDTLATMHWGRKWPVSAYLTTTLEIGNNGAKV